MKNRLVFETKLNIFLSELLNQVGVISRSEVLGAGRQRRDIVVYHQGLRLVLEGSYSRTDAQQDAEKRIEQLACDIALAICYPRRFPQHLTDREVKERLERSEFRVRMVASEDISGTLFQFLYRKKVIARPIAEWQRCNLKSLESLIREVGQFIITEEHMRETEERVSEFIDDFVDCLSSFSQSKAIARNLYDVLYKLYGFSIGDPIEIKEAIFAQAGLAVLLSSIYYQTIGYVHNLRRLRARAAVEGGPQSAVERATEDILQVDYEPIFETTQEILPLFPQMPQVFQKLVNLASDIAAKKTLLRRDIAGRIYHKIVGSWSVQKGLATFYTQIPAAYLLLHLAKPQLSKICDFACGSGTLLTAAYSAMNSEYRFRLLEKGIDKKPEVIEKEFHTQFIESCYGFDALTYAAQITALNLALHSPEIALSHFHIDSIPLGYRDDCGFASLGSLELIREPMLHKMTKTITRTGVKTTKKESLAKIISNLGFADLIAMNPPFTRATGRGGRRGGGLFGFVSDENIRKRIVGEYNTLREEVKRNLERIGISLLDNRELANLFQDNDFRAYRSIGAAGEGLLFLYLAHMKVRKGGKICFVLPKALLSGISWFLARCLLASKYHVEYFVVSYDSENGYNFSESASLSECLFVAKNKESREYSEDEETKFIILLKKPKTSIEAIALSRTIEEKTEKRQDYVEAGGAKAFIVRANRKEMLEYIDNWGRFIFLPNLTLVKDIKQLQSGIIKIEDIEGKIPLTRLNNLISSIGIDAHQFHDSFEVISENVPGSLGVLYGGGEEHRRKLEVLPNAYALPRGDKGKRLFKEKAGRLLLPDRIWLETAHTLSMISKENTLSNLFYAVKLKDEDENKRKVVCLYLNTTWGILIVLANREETRGAWIRLKMSQWRLVPVLNVSALSENKIRKLAGIFDRFKDRRLQRIPMQYGVAGRIDKLRTELDLAFLEAMDISVKESDLLSLYEEIGSALRQWIGS